MGCAKECCANGCETLLADLRAKLAATENERDEARDQLTRQESFMAAERAQIPTLRKRAEVAEAKLAAAGDVLGAVIGTTTLRPGECAVRTVEHAAIYAIEGMRDRAEAAEAEADRLAAIITTLADECDRYKGLGKSVAEALRAALARPGGGEVP